MEDSKIYFPHLNGLRFIAAFLVIISHVEQFKSFLKLDSCFWEHTATAKFFRLIGGQSVVLFFVLSGFLITYLLLSEEKKCHTIDVKKFYVRRILRIWPLYLLVILLALFVFPHLQILSLPGFSAETIQSDIGTKLTLYIFFFANLVASLFGFIPYASQTWSIGTEEQFYLAWPVIIKTIKKHRLSLMISIVLTYNALRFLLTKSYFDSNAPGIEMLQAFLNGFTIDCMAVGAFFAVLLFNRSVMLKLFLNQWVFYFCILVVLCSWAKGISYPYINSVVYSGLYAIIILNFAANKSHHINLENPVLNYLGNISYGLYMLHPIAIVIAIKTAIFVGCPNNILIYPLSLLLAILLSAASYRWYEAYFLKYKSHFALVKSGSAPQAQD